MNCRPQERTRRVTSDKGVTVVSFGGKYKRCRDYGQLLTLAEVLQAAKELIDGCLRRWCKDALSELGAVVE